eukprot:UN28830
MFNTIQFLHIFDIIINYQTFIFILFKQRFDVGEFTHFSLHSCTNFFIIIKVHRFLFTVFECFSKEFITCCPTCTSYT